MYKSKNKEYKHCVVRRSHFMNSNRSHDFRFSRKIALFGLLLALCSPVMAINMGFMKNSVLTEFSKSELNSFRTFILQSLDDLPDVKVAVWKSENDGLIGKLKPRFTHTVEGKTCRRTAFYVTNKVKKPEQYQFDICKINSKWKIMATPAGNFRTSDWDMLRAEIVEALNYSGLGQPFSWYNKKTKNSGVIVVLSSLNNKKPLCRSVAISISDSAGLSSNGVYKFCKADVGEWERKIEE